MYKFINSVKCNGSFDLHEEKKEIYLKMQPLLLNFGQNNKNNLKIDKNKEKLKSKKL